METLRALICILLTVYWLILIVRIIFSWIPNPPEPLRPVQRAVGLVTDPILAPFRGLLPPLQLGGAALDLSPILLFLLIGVIQRIIC